MWRWLLLVDPRVFWDPGPAVWPGCAVGGPRAVRAASFDQRLGASARCVALMPSYGCQPAIPHVIPRRLIQTLNLRRWNCNVFGASRKMTAINYVRDLAGGGVSAARFGRPHREPSAPRAVRAARFDRRFCSLSGQTLPATGTASCVPRRPAFRSLRYPPHRRGPGHAVPPVPSMPVAVGILHYMKPSGGVSSACRTPM